VQPGRSQPDPFLTPDSAVLPDPEEKRVEPARLPFPVVGLGASAGGLNALQTFFAGMPADNGMAFVVVLHLSPDHESHAAEILQRSTRMPVRQVTRRAPLKAGHVYVVAPTMELAMNDGHLECGPSKRITGARTAIDQFLRTLAEVHQERAIGVVLSGMGSDGAVGLTRMKERGGVTLVQSPDDAEYDGMPRAAIATGMADIVLPVAEMPQCVLDIWRNAKQITLPADAAPAVQAKAVSDAQEAHAAEVALAEVLATVKRQTRHDFKYYKRATMLRRIERRLQVRALPDLQAYRDFMSAHPEEARLLVQDLLISVTNFFRDPEAFMALEREAIPRFFEGRAAADPVRVWVAGCATGEEAYSVAMLLREAAELMPVPPDFQVFATDIDERAIAVARKGLYPAGIVADVPPARLRKHFTKEGDHYRVVKSLREKVLFAEHNLLRDPPFSRVDMVCCRNLLIYLERPAQVQILDTFRFAIKPQGVLFLGTSESADMLSSSFGVLEKKHRIFRSEVHVPAAHPLPVVASSMPGRVSAQHHEDPRARHSPTFAEIHRKSLELLLPPSVLLDEAGVILHLSEGAGQFMEATAGEPSRSLLSNLAAPLRLEMRTALYRAAQTGLSVEVRGARVQRAGKDVSVDLAVRPFVTPEGVRLTLVVFAESAEAAALPAAPADDATKELIAHMEDEIRRLKEQLQQTVEESETSHEELKASNEELQAINEELRSATEELETGKEELQSVNEELVTVNQELKSKVEETNRVNDDLLNLASATGIATIFVDGELRVRRFTQEARQLFNLIDSDLGRSLLDITHKLDYPDMDKDAMAAYETLRESERTVRSVDGRHYLARCLPFRAGDRKISGAVLSFVDVTSLRRAEEEVRVAQERLRIAAQTSADFAIMTMDPHGVITAWNAGAARLFGYDESEAVGQHVGMIFSAEERAGGVPEAELARARQEGRVEDERWRQRKDGTRFFCSGVTTAMGAAGGLGFSRIARDATVHRQQAAARESQLLSEQRASRQAQAVNRMKDEFLAVMSHELKHPLNLIHMNAELLTRMPAAQQLPAVVRAGATIRQAASNQAKIIDDLLDLSRANTGKLTLKVQPLDLRRTIEPIVSAVQADARAAGVELALAVRSDPLVIVADPVRIEQITWNLVNNAVKFSPRGAKVVVEISQEGDEARLQVSDTGRGIDPEFLPDVFEMFSQDRTVAGGESRGLGIGLSLVRDLVQAHGGRVEARSPGLGKGATFIAWLPLNNPGLGEARKPAKTGSSLKGLRILVVDDSEDTLVVFSGLLRLEQAQVDVATSGAEALEILEREPGYDLLISDIGMEGMDGWQLMDAIRSGKIAPHIPAIALSGYGREADVTKALEAGFDVHLSKPASVGDLRQAWERIRPKR
jgi:two-component system, chemotaxis family, CheB/CheR fusion protein